FANTFYMCEEDQPVLRKSKSDRQVITQYILDEANADQYSEFGKILEAAGLSNLLAVRGPFTLFLPTNDALQEYYLENNLTSYLDLDSVALRSLILNHLVGQEIPSNDIGLGTLRDTNARGDYVATEFLGSDIILNKVAMIIDRDIYTANGVIHAIDKVLNPIEDDVYTILENTPGYTLFTAGLQMTGLMDTLKTIRFLYGPRYARTRFTILAVADTSYQRNGINTVEDLINNYTDEPGSITQLDNGFYRYMEYHCLGGTYYLSDLETKLYPILSYDNNLSMHIDDDYKINLNSQTDEYTGFILEESNIPAKNGVIHTVNNLLPVTTPEPLPIIFEVTDFFDFEQGDYFRLHQYAKFSDGQNTFEKIKWGGDFLQYYYKDHDSPSEQMINYDCLNMNGYWWIEITVPKIMKGRYHLEAFTFLGTDYTDCLVYIDDVLQEELFDMGRDAGSPGLTTIAHVDWEKTEEHKVKLVGINASLLFWDYILFTPE
ncbi:MAG: fasciclin domain-containing protein, partial [Bacteroidales bacterium]